jgi:PAS domain S-box-containing protein
MMSMSLKRLAMNEPAGRELLKAAIERGWCQSDNWRHRRKDGTVIDVQLSGHMVEYDGERAVLSINRDVTEQNRLRQAADRERRVFLGGPTVVFRWANVEGYPIEHVSDNVAQFGYTVEDMISGRVAAASMVHPEDLQRVLEEAKHADETGASSYESEYRVLTKSGETRWVHDYTALVRDAAGKTLYFEGCLTDQTNLRRAEEQRRQLERQLWQSQRVESLGVLVGGVAHDFNNLLVGILGNAGLARRQLDRLEELERSLGRIEEAGKFAADLIKRLVGQAGAPSSSAEPVDLAELGALMVDTLGPRVPRWINVCRAGGSAWTRVDGVAVRQAVMNLLTNAADAIGTRKGEVCVRTGVREFDPAAERDCCVGRELPRGKYSFLCVEDSGGGISDEVKSGMFEPFVSTGHEGRGLGLALVRSIMRRTGGAVCVRTVRGVGTWFELLWPADAVPEASEAAPEVRERRTVLVIDDHAAVRGTAVEMIRSMGYRVLEARLGEEGLALAEASKPDAVLLDVTLPGMSGWQVLEKLRVVSPETRVVMSSGHDVARLASRAKPDVLLPKPYVFDDLRAALESLVPIGASEAR